MVDGRSCMRAGRGEEDQSIYMVKSGLLKAYYLSSDGKENIKSFLMPGDNTAS